MSDDQGWRPLDGQPGVGREAFVVSPFARLARTHGFSVAGDALFAIGLAGTIFFLSPADAARSQVALYLLLTIAPFAVIAPVLGPALDRVRGGRRWMVTASAAARALICFALIGHLDSLLFYPEAFLMLVGGKAYQISKSAIVPTTVRNDAELVEANSKLSLLSGLAVVLAAGPGFLLMWLGSPEWVIGAAGVLFVIMAALALQLPRTAVAREPTGSAEKEELRGTGILLAASAMGLLRGIVGFLSFLLAFFLKDEAAWMLGVIAAMAQGGYLGGSWLAPRIRKVAREEHILIGSLVTVGVVAVGAALTAGLFAAAVLALVVGAASSAGKQSFDSIVQRDAPDANRGRSFARFETRFQIVWVLGALLPTAITIPLPLGFLLIAIAAAFATASYLFGVRGATIDAAARIRRWRRVRREERTELTAQQLGFRPGEVFDEPPPPPPVAEVGLTDQRLPADPPEASPAALAAEQRRARERADQEARRVQQERAAAEDLAQAEQALVEDERAPDLDWEPNRQS